MQKMFCSERRAFKQEKKCLRMSCSISPLSAEFHRAIFSTQPRKSSVQKNSQIPTCKVSTSISYQKFACSGRCNVKLQFYLLFSKIIITTIALIATVNSTILMQLLSSSGEKVVPVRHDPPVQQQQGEPTNSFADVSLAGGLIFCLFTFLVCCQSGR